MKVLSIIFLFVLSYGSVMAQPTTRSGKQLSVGAGLGYLTVKDISSSPLRYAGLGPALQVGYEHNQKKSFQRVLLNAQAGGIQNGVRRQSGIMAYKAQLAYARFWVINPGSRTSWALGGSADVWANARMFGNRENNPISYEAGSALNVGARISRSFTSRFSRLNASFQVLLPAVAYVIRPAYGVPYPEAFLQDGVFNHQDEGLIGPMLTSGKVENITTFFRMQTTTALTYSLSGAKAIRVSYGWEYYDIPFNLPVRQGNHALVVSFVKHIN